MNCFSSDDTTSRKLHCAAGPQAWEAAWPRASRDFSEGRLFHRKMLLCWNLKHSMGMCWFGHHLCWKPGRREGLAGQPARVRGSRPAQPGAPRVCRNNNACETPPINYFYQNVRHTFIKIFKRCVGFKRLKKGNINPLSSGIHIRARRLQFLKPSAKKKFRVWILSHCCSISQLCQKLSQASLSERPD